MHNFFVYIGDDDDAGKKLLTCLNECVVESLSLHFSAGAATTRRNGRSQFTNGYTLKSSTAHHHRHHIANILVVVQQYIPITHML